ncbi:phage major tail tube protein [Serratia odorifera]|uniref:phage major tail tube protein n=1 Tax=Serratia odorifera TaxID=618 RepID=UPI00235DEC6E|nr:phage major tail tube protein [Serratia odorifera]
MSTKNTLRAWTFFAGGIRIEGAHEYTPPVLSIVKGDLRTGAQDAPSPVDDGMEALTCQVKFYGIDTDILTRFGFTSGSINRFSAYQGYLSNGTAMGTIEEIEGFVHNVTPDARSNQNMSENAVTVDIAIRYYKQSKDGRELIEIDTERFIRRVNGVDQLRNIASKIRL